jgi:hypothetical protein
MITIHLTEGINPDDAQRIRSGLTDKLWEHGVRVDCIEVAVRKHELATRKRHIWSRSRSGFSAAYWRPIRSAICCATIARRSRLRVTAHEINRISAR